MARLVVVRGAINGGLFLTSAKFPDGDWRFEKALNIEGLFHDSVYAVQYLYCCADGHRY